MKMRVFASSKPGYSLRRNDALLMAGHEAGICYMKDDFQTILAEPRSNTMKRVKVTVGSGHHSVAGHPTYNLIFSGLPKIIAMIINNEKDYNTSEKSARYTVMKASPRERKVYLKWIEIFKGLIHEKYPSIKSSVVEKLAQENARYFISVFTPATTMGYTVDLRQINYLIGFCEKMIAGIPDDDPNVDPFMVMLKPWLVSFSKMLAKRFDVEGLRDNKDREFSLFAKRYRRESVGETYCINYRGTFAQLAQAQRNRTLYYEMMVPKLDQCEFFVPPIIEDEAIRAEYLRDMEQLKDLYPQGMLVHINERGPIEKFCEKCGERLCGAAQLEICLQTVDSLHKLMSGAIENDYPEVYLELARFDRKTKCQFSNYKCTRPCPLGPNNAFTRLV